jgi:ABC-2 type transport system ATP-binding protein
MVEERVRCPRCNNIQTVAGNPGATIIITCPHCGQKGKAILANKNPDTHPVIHIINLTKTFGQFTAVDNLNITINQGETYGLIGPNGSGKTTTIKILCGLLNQTSGKAEILGQQVPCKAIMQRVGYMPQETALYMDNTIHENLAFFAGLYGITKTELPAREQAMLRFVGLEKWRDALITTLSGGMRHRVSLACALIHDPEIIFLDEPTVGVDPELRATFWEYFHDLSLRGRTVVITTHYMDEADHCSRVGLLRSGVLIAEGSPSALKLQTRATSLEDAFMRLGGRKMI